jgi:hypothetical protein
MNSRDPSLLIGGAFSSLLKKIKIKYNGNGKETQQYRCTATSNREHT